MAIFGPKPWVNPSGKMSIFPLFELLVFIAQKGVFPFQNIVKDIFWPILPKKKQLKKWPFLDQNHGLTPLEKCQFFDFLNFFFYSLERRFFTLEYDKRHFLAYIAYKKKVEKMAIFGPKPWVNAFGKMSIFQLFKLLAFIAQKGVFPLQNIVKDIFLAYIT